MDLTKLRARIVGINTTDVSGLTLVWNYLVFEPGASIGGGVAADPLLGYAIIGVLQDPTAPTSLGDPVSDWCAPVWNEYKLYNEMGGVPYRKNPGDGVYNFVTYTVPAPDADNDGIENPMDPCPYEPNVSGWDPRGVLERGNTPGDNDVDGLPDECDPHPTVRDRCSAVPEDPNEPDCDGWPNRSDNCPLVANGLVQRDVPGVGNQADSDGDDIGDACDQNVATRPGSTIDGLGFPVCNVSTVTIGSDWQMPVDPMQLAPCGSAATAAALPKTGGPAEGGYGMSSLSLLGAGLLLAGLGLAGVAFKRLHSGLQVKT